ncbi:Oligopeptide-binding protein OppA [Baekduia alba]|uniref:ABC transporter substrate-binding protein n=1 Tax=Baekduia alba TaxID=2997333 RepID=UPI002341D750|nr:ABC transporter substrate-binding protein [Baekduia alba]WCB97007.1 Oligopeptide-binding protein OppA [Baekduia alba]
MSRSHLRFLVAGMLVVLAFVVAACGGDDNSSSSTSKSSAGTESNAKTADAPAKKGGKITMLAASDVDFVDPGHTYYTFGEMVTLATNRPLYSFKPDDANKPVPDLAADEAQVSSDKKTVTIKIRPGVKYAPPVNRDVTSADVKYAIERFFSVNVGGQYPGYFSVIDGAPSKPTTGVKPISGIETPDDQTIVFHLKDPTAVSFVAALVMPITVPVPKEYASKFDAKNPSTYNTHVAFTGPYMIENNSSGSLTGYKPGKSISMVRNPNWDAKTDYRPANADSFFIRTNASDANVSARQVIDGSSMLLDTNPPANILKDLVTQVKDQYLSVPSGGYRYFPLNTEVKPFDNINVRKAVMAGFSRNAARLARGGKYVGDIATHWLPPDFPGFDQSGGFKGFPDIDYFNDKNEDGDMAVAAKYFKAAGYASGKYEGNDEILIVGANADPGKAQAEVASAQLQKMGFKTRLRLVPQDAVYTDWCQVPSKKVGMCGGAGWFKDFADPQSMLEPVFKGSLINRQSGNINYSMLNDPKVDDAMNKAALLEGDARLQAWANVDKMIVQDAAGIPFIWDKTTLVRSKNVNGVANPYIALWDLSFTSIK